MRFRILADLSGDLRAAARGWRRSPSLFLTAVLTLILGIGLASAIFAFADGYLFRALPFPEADRLFFVRVPDAAIAGTTTAAEAAALRETSVARFGLVEWGGSTRLPNSGEVALGNRSVTLRVEGVSRGFAETVRVPLEIGRWFADGDHAAVTPVPVWLTYRTWQREFGADRAVLGRVFTMRAPTANAKFVVVGVLDRLVTAFDLNNPPPDLIAPALEETNLGPNRLAFPIVRLSEGLSPEQATAEIASTLQAVSPAPEGGSRQVRLLPLRTYQVFGGQPTARVFFAGALLVLALVTVNLVHLLLARGVARTGEVATRVALGAAPWRVARLLLVDSLLLGAAGIAGGLVLGQLLARAIESSLPGFPTAGRNLSLVAMHFDGRAIVFAGIAIFVVVLCGTAWPLWRTLRVPVTALAGSGRHAAGRLSSKTSRAVLASEVGVATVIIVGAVFMSLGIWRYLNQPLGFELDDRLSVFLEAARTPVPDPQAQDWAAVVATVRGIPGVQAAAFASGRNAGPLEIGGVAVDDREVRTTTVEAEYFDAWGIRTVEGRVFGPAESATGDLVAVVDEKVARRYWPDGSPVGQTLRVADDPVRVVVGVVAHERRRLALETPGVVYVPLDRPDQRDSIVVWAPGLSADDLAARLAGHLVSVIPGYRPAVRSLSFESLFARDASEATFQAPILAAFGLATFVVVGIGLFGLVSYLTGQRRRELAVRMALGAGPRQIRVDVSRQVALPAALGLAAGLLVAATLERAVQATVFGWESSGVAAMTFVAIALGCVTMLAVVGPVRRALRVEPAIELRAE